MRSRLGNKKWFVAVLGCAAVIFFAFFSGVLPMNELVFVLNPTAARAFTVGDYYFNTEGRGEYNLEKARGYYERALELDPQTLAAWHQLARIDFLQGNFSKALAEINTQIELHGDAVSGSYYVRGLIHGYRKEFTAAEVDFKKYLLLHPKSWGVYNDLSWIYFQEGNFSEAADIAREGLALRPNNAWLLTSYGVSLMNLGRKEEARSVLEKALLEARALTPQAWSHNNPGNDPRIAEEGLRQMIAVIDQNLITLTR